MLILKFNMAAFDEYLLQEGYENLEEARKLSEVESKDDPEDDPFKSKYKARTILQAFKSKIEGFLNDDPSNESLMFLSAAVTYRLAVNFLETEELHYGEDNLKEVINSVEQHRLRKEGCNILQNAYNQMGILCSSRSNLNEALGFLSNAEELYKEFSHEVGGGPLSVDEILQAPSGDEDSKEHSRTETFEGTYTHTLYYLAQVYGKLEEAKKSAEYCQVTLRRQLESKKYDPVEWALNCATLSQFYIMQDNYYMARHCLASASRIFQEVPPPPESGMEAPENESEEERQKREFIPQRKADIARCWAKYGLALMEFSRDKWMSEVEKMDENKFKDVEKEEEEAAAADAEKENERMRFNLELTSIEEQITWKDLALFDEARVVFLAVQKWLSTAKEYYSLDGHCSDYVEILQDHSKVYKMLAFFEGDLDRQCKMQKRRADLLEAVLKELNPQFYLLVCRQLMFEIAEIYQTMLDLKVAIIEAGNQAPTPHQVKKINQLTAQAIGKFQDYLDSLRDTNKKLPDEFSDDDVRPALVAQFHIGRLSTKYIKFEMRERLENMQKGLERYRFIVDYCKRNPQARQIVSSELSICEEMVQLVPLKMESIRAGADM